MASNRIFSLQLAGHDGDFGPREKPQGWRRYIARAALVPAAILFFMPSFRIGLMQLQKPEFTIPDSVAVGHAFTLPSDLNISRIEVSGQTPPMISKPAGLYLVAVPHVPELDVTLIFKSQTNRGFKKLFRPRFEHPVAYFYNKEVHVAEDPAAPRTPASAPALAPATTNRLDGLINASCWKEPTLKDLDPSMQPVHRGHRSHQVRLATITNSGPGEVVQTTTTTPGSAEKSVVIYHGGGLYSRFNDVRELRVRKGDHLQTGQVIGVINRLAPTVLHRSSTGAPWAVYMSQTEINPEGFLELSSQLCGSM